MSEPEVIVIVIGLIVTIHAIYTKTINWFSESKNLEMYKSDIYNV